MLLQVIPTGCVYTYTNICIYIYICVDFKAISRTCAALQNEVLGTCDGEHGGCLDICRKGHAVHTYIYNISAAIMIQFCGRALLFNDEVFGTCDGEFGFLRRVAKQCGFCRDPRHRETPQAVQFWAHAMDSMVLD